MRILALAFIILTTKFYQLPADSSVNDKSDSLIVVNGVIKDFNNDAIEGVSIALLKSSDSSMIKINLTNNEGKFQFDNVKEGKYRIKTSHIGYESYTADFAVAPGSKNITLSLITLKPQNVNLKTVTVVAKKNILELKSDKIVFNVENSITAAGENALEILNKAPGVSVSSDDNVALKGNRGVQVLINGRSTQLSGGDLASFLKSMPAGNIQAVEIISNPSAKFDATGTAGIINIRLKPLPDAGFNVNISGNLLIGKTSKTNEQVDVNYRTGKVNMFSSYGFNHDQYETSRTMNRMFDAKLGSNDTYNQSSLEKEIKTNHSYKFGLDYQINSRHVLGAMVNGFSTRSKDSIDSRTNVSSGNNVIDSVLLSNNFSQGKRKNNNYNLNYKYSDTNGTAFNVDLNFIRFNRNDESLQPNYYTDAMGNSLNNYNTYYNEAPSNIDILVGKMDFDKRIFLGNLTIGTKMSSVNSENEFRFYDVLNGAKIINSTLTNTFSYKEDVAAGYLNLNNEMENWSYQIGLRAEHTFSRGSLASSAAQNDKDVKNSYLNFFPSASVSYKPSSSHTFSLAYSRRIQRPDYQSLNPFEFRLDQLTFSRGNPFLKPQLAHSLQLTYSLGQYLIASVGYITTNNVVALIIDSAGSNTITYIPENVTTGTNINASLSTNLNPTDWWTINATISGYRSTYKGTVKQFPLNNNGFTMLTNGQNNFKLSKTLSAELSFFYRSPEVFGSFRNKSTGQVNIGMQAKFLGDKGVLRVNYTDIFKTLNLRSTSNFNNLNIRSTQNPESRIFKIGVSYRFGSNMVKESRNRRVGSEDENRRL